MHRRHGVRQRWFGSVAAALTLALTAGCSGGASASWRSPGVTPSGSAAASDGPVADGPLAMKIAPASNAANVSPGEPVTVSVANGSIESVAVTASSGKTVPGRVDTDKRTWRTSEPLEYGTSYTVAAVAIGADGKREERTGTFKTVRPGNYVMPYLQANAMGPLSGCKPTCGVGTVITVRFDEPISDQKVAEKAVKITTDPPVELRAYWLGRQELMIRPEKYWVPGTSVDVSVEAFGRNFGNGLYGQGNASAAFKIGPSKVAIADNKTHQMLVYLDGNAEPVRRIPVSLGKGGTTNGGAIHFWTMSGTYTVLHKQPSTRMTSASYGIKDKKHPDYYDQVIYDTVQLSKDGIYTHKRDWAPMNALGGFNSSHGCINIGPDHSRWFYNLFGLGDVVQVKNSPVKLDLGVAAGALWDYGWSKLHPLATA